MEIQEVARVLQAKVDAKEAEMYEEPAVKKNKASEIASSMEEGDITCRQVSDLSSVGQGDSARRFVACWIPLGARRWRRAV